MALTAQLRRAVIITHDCDLDNDQKKHVTVALFRALDHLITYESKDVIRNNGNDAFFYLPEHSDKIPEGYADMRRLTTTTHSFLLNRLASLSDESVLHLRAVLLRFFTRREFPQDHEEVIASA